jgi:hypothetical protein
MEVGHLLNRSFLPMKRTAMLGLSSDFLFGSVVKLACYKKDTGSRFRLGQAFGT